MSANVFELVCFNRYRQARLVLEAGGDPNFPNDQQETPLMACAMFLREPDRRMQLMRMLIGFGADVNAQNDKGQTLMMYACILNQVDTLVLLINKENVDLNKCDVSGNTALMYACALGRAPLVYVLLEVHRSGQHPINIYQRNHEGHTAREIAEQRRFSQICELFAEVVDNDYWSSYNELSRDTTIANGKAYPVKIEENRIESQPQTDPPTHPDLTSMMERILQVGNEQRVEQNNFVPTSDKTIPGVSSDAVCFNTTDAGLAKPDDNNNPENYPKSARSSRTDGSLGWECKNVSEGKLSAKSNVEYTDGSITDRSRRKKSRQRSKHRAVADAQNGTGEPQNGLTRSGSFRNRNSLMKSGSAESGGTVQHEDIVVGPTIANETGNGLEEYNPDKNSIRTSNTKKVNYYTRHDIPDYNPAPSLGTVDVNGDSIRPPRPPSRSRSRARRRKTTEVCVTVSDGKIVPFRKHSGTKAGGGSTEDGLLSTWPVPEGTYAGTINQQHAHSNVVTATDSSSRSPIRAQMQTKRRLEQKHSSPNSSMDFDSAYSQLVNPNYNKYTSNYGYATNYSERNYKTPWTGRQKVSNYDSNPRIRGADMRDSIDCSSGGIFREGNKLTRTSSFKESSRKPGSYRSVAW